RRPVGLEQARGLHAAVQASLEQLPTLEEVLREGRLRVTGRRKAQRNGGDLLADLVERCGRKVRLRERFNRRLELLEVPVDHTYRHVAAGVQPGDESIDLSSQLDSSAQVVDAVRDLGRYAFEIRTPGPNLSESLALLVALYAQA